jgi:anti-sigma factor RsiW
MDCTDVTDRLAPYLDDELAPGEIELLERHLDGCEACRTRIEKLSAQDLSPPQPAAALLARVSSEEFWAGMDSRLAEEIEAVEASSGPLRQRFVASISWKVVGYAAAMALALLWGMHSHREVRIARAEVESLARQLEREQRLAEGPPALSAGVLPSAQVVSGTAVPAAATSTTHPAPTSNGAPVRNGDLELAGYRPHRSTF